METALPQTPTWDFSGWELRFQEPSQAYRWGLFLLLAIGVHASLLLVVDRVMSERATYAMVAQSAGAGAPAAGPLEVGLVAFAAAPEPVAPPVEKASDPTAFETAISDPVPPLPVEPVLSEFVQPAPKKVARPIKRVLAPSTDKSRASKKLTQSLEEAQRPMAGSSTARAVAPRAPSVSGQPGSGGSTLGVGGGTVRGTPDYLSNPIPTYPSLSRRLKEEGLVLLTVDLTALGTVQRLLVKKSSGFDRLDEAAERAVKGWRFKPSTIGGVAVADTIEVPIRFALK